MVGRPGTRPSGWWLLVVVAVGVSVLSWLARLLPGVVGGAVVAVAATVGAALAQRGQQLIEEGARQSAESRFVLLTDRRGRIPRVRDIGNLLDVGVHPAAPEGDIHAADARVPPFVRRDRSGEIEDAVRAHDFILIVGESTAGKSRAAFEAVRAVLPGAALIAPDPAHPAALQAVETALRSRRDAVVWLDDIERYLGAGGLTSYRLHGLTGPGNGRRTVVVGTIRAQERARYLDVQGMGPQAGDSAGRATARDVLALAHEIRLDRRWHEAEVARAQTFGQDRRLTQAVGRADRYGVAEYLAAGPQLLAAWQDAWAPEGPHVRGAALVSAAVEARRAGWSRPLPVALLRELHEQHLAARGGIRLRPENWEEALTWATTPLYAISSPLAPHDSQPDSYNVFDYLPDTVDADSESTPILEETWARLLAAADPRACEDIGWSAVAHARRTTAGDAFQQALDNGVLTGAVGLALVLGEANQPEEACQILRAALRQVPPDADPEIPFSLRGALAWWTGASGHVEEALALSTALLEEARLRYGDDRGETIEAALSAARWASHTGRTSEALTLAREVQERSVRLFGPDSLTTLSCRFEVAGTTAESGRMTEATGLWGKLAADANRLLGVHHLLTVDALWNQAGMVFEAGDTTQGLRLLAEVVNGRTTVYGSSHPRTFAGRLQLTAWTGESGQCERALSLLHDLVRDTTRALGPHHVLTLAARHQQALRTADSGRLGPAAAEFTLLLDQCERYLGAEHELTQDCRARLSSPDRSTWYYLPPSW